MSTGPADTFEREQAITWLALSFLERGIERGLSLEEARDLCTMAFARIGISLDELATSYTRVMLAVPGWEMPS